MSKYKKVFIVCGHGSECGAVAIDGTTEHAIAEKISKKVIELLGGFAVPVGVNHDMNLMQKINIINKICSDERLNYKNSLIVSIHVDWRGAREGTGAYYYSGSLDSKNFAKKIADSVAKVGNRKTNWIKGDKDSGHGQLGIIRNTNPLACLVEIGSLRADNDKTDGLELLKTEKGQNGIAMAIRDGIFEFACSSKETIIKKPQETHERHENLDKIEKLQKEIYSIIDQQEKVNIRIKEKLHESAELLREIT